MDKIQRTSKGNYVYRGYEIRRYTHERNYSIYNPEINEFLANETSLQDCTNSIDIDLKTIPEILREVKQSFHESTYNRISERINDLQDQLDYAYDPYLGVITTQQDIAEFHNCIHILNSYLRGL